MRKILRFGIDSAVILILGAIAAGALLRTGPGSDTDERELNSHLSASSIAAIRAERERSHSLAESSVLWFQRALKGDLGRSEITGVPVLTLLSDRIRPTLRTVSCGAALGFFTAVLGATATVLFLPRSFELLANTGFLALLSLPSGLVVLLAVFGRAPISLAVAAAVAPRVYFYAARMFAAQRSAPFTLSAVALGISPLRIAFFHILPALRPELAALFGFAIVNAIAAAIPAEVLSGTPGFGQLAWKSASDRDLPVLIAVTLVMIVAARGVTLLSSLTASPTEAGRHLMEGKQRPAAFAVRLSPERELRAAP